MSVEAELHLSVEQVSQVISLRLSGLLSVWSEIHPIVLAKAWQPTAGPAKHPLWMNSFPSLSEINHFPRLNQLKITTVLPKPSNQSMSEYI